MINWWQVWTIVLACACACLFVVTGLALWLMYRYKAMSESLDKENGGLLKAVADQAERNALTLEAYAALQEQADSALQERDTALQKVKEVQFENNMLIDVANDIAAGANNPLEEAYSACIAERDTLQKQLDGQAQPQPEAVVPRKSRKKTNTATMLSQE